MNEHAAYEGRISDHLYQDCPAIQRWKDSPYGSSTLGRRLNGLVDPEGTDICRICYLVWKESQDGEAR